MNTNEVDKTAPAHDVTYKIGIVDDDPFLLDMYNLKFQAAGHSVSCFTDAQSLLDDLRSGTTYDAVLLDLVMPQVSGHELLRVIREENLCSPSAALIVLSNQNQQDDIDEADSYHIDGYLVKANTLPSEVLDQVVAIIGKKQAN